MPRRQERKAARVHDPQALHPPHPRPRVEHRTGIGAITHLTRTTGVENGAETLPHKRQDILIRYDARGRTGEVLPTDKHGRHGRGLEEGARALVARDGDGLVGRVGEPIGVDEWRGAHVGGGDADGAAGEGRDEHGGDGGVVVAIGGRVEDVVLLVAVVGRGGDVFQLGPVGGQGGEVSERGAGQVRAHRLRYLFEGEQVGAAVGEHALRRGGVELCGRLRGEGWIREGGGGEDFDTVARPAEDVVPHVLTHSW